MQFLHCDLKIAATVCVIIFYLFVYPLHSFRKASFLDFCISPQLEQIQWSSLVVKVSLLIWIVLYRTDLRLLTWTMHMFKRTHGKCIFSWSLFSLQCSSKKLWRSRTGIILAHLKMFWWLCAVFPWVPGMWYNDCMIKNVCREPTSTAIFFFSRVQ